MVNTKIAFKFSKKDNHKMKFLYCLITCHVIYPYSLMLSLDLLEYVLFNYITYMVMKLFCNLR